LTVNGCKDSPEWDGKFLDEMLREPSKRGAVVDTIARDLKELLELVCEFRREKQ